MAGKKGIKLKRYNKEEVAFLVNTIPGRSYKESAALFNERFMIQLSSAQIRDFCNRRKIRTGLTGHFTKGNIPHNKGKKNSTGFSRTRFKKGNIPKNRRPLGAERINPHGIIEVKTGYPAIWKAKHILLWEQNNGHLPENHIVFFMDGNKQNPSLHNLVALSRKELRYLYVLLDECCDIELRKAVINIAKLMAAVQQRRKKTECQKKPSSKEQHP